jgi:flagellar biosynthesis/type III secretory pathway protein FliH
MLGRHCTTWVIPPAPLFFYVTQTHVLYNSNNNDNKSRLRQWTFEDMAPPHLILEHRDEVKSDGVRGAVPDIRATQVPRGIVTSEEKTSLGEGMQRKPRKEEQNFQRLKTQYYEEQIQRLL